MATDFKYPMFESKSQEKEEKEEEEESIPCLHTVKNLCRSKDSSTTEPGLPWWHILFLLGGLFAGGLYIHICFSFYTKVISGVR